MRVCGAISRLPIKCEKDENNLRQHFKAVFNQSKGLNKEGMRHRIQKTRVQVYKGGGRKTFKDGICMASPGNSMYELQLLRGSGRKKYLLVD